MLKEKEERQKGDKKGKRKKRSKNVFLVQVGDGKF